MIFWVFKILLIGIHFNPEDENFVAAELDGDKLPFVFGVGNFFF